MGCHTLLVRTRRAALWTTDLAPAANELRGPLSILELICISPLDGFGLETATHYDATPNLNQPVASRQCPLAS